MKVNTKLIDDLKYYLHNFYQYGSWSKAEEINFLKLYAEYVFNYNDLKFNENLVQFHFGGEIGNSNVLAVVYKDVKNKQPLFNIYLPKINSLQNFAPMKDKVKRQRIVLSGTDYLIKINFTVSLIYLAGHELHHVIQWINDEPTSKSFDDFEKRLTFTIEDENLSEYNHKKTLKNIEKFKNNHLSYADNLTTAEKDAENKTVEYFKNLVQIIIKNEEDQDFRDFLIESLNKMLFELKCRIAENSIIKRMDNQLIKQFAKKHNLDKKSLENIQIP